VWQLAARQHGVVTRLQLLGMGLSSEAIAHRLANGRLHPVMRGVYAVGRPALSQSGRWMAAVLRCGPDAVLSHSSAAAAWNIKTSGSGPIEVSVAANASTRPRGIRVHRRATLRECDIAVLNGIPVTSPALTLVDLAVGLESGDLEAAINEADKHGLIAHQTLRRQLDDLPRHPGIAILRLLLDRHTFVLTDSELERRFVPIAREAGLPVPLTGARLNGFRVDFFWPELGLVVETDGLRYHRTPAQQARDRLRDQAHAAAGLTALRFSHSQVRYDPAHVRVTLAAVAARLGRRQHSPGRRS
jgi:Protein of unknown function (DUF559)